MEQEGPAGCGSRPGVTPAEAARRLATAQAELDVAQALDLRRDVAAYAIAVEVLTHLTAELGRQSG